ncbi:hypothetical protein LTR56_001590 [Elasticomyces elasticus]|nr:hypothetical protein LTR56_001590 [Elasticomyces elasticus]KAK3667358.1 hypothetical protein LTR22_001874 [Elasticomyces elasticus]KAK4932562.1 hypothetical protein LTR49_000986 [Elasticomyces elasticus]KAK5769584.1 hypothetical protein LTS12_000034 [Elasticomyces elasticus]
MTSPYSHKQEDLKQDTNIDSPDPEVMSTQGSTDTIENPATTPTKPAHVENQATTPTKHAYVEDEETTSTEPVNVEDFKIETEATSPGGSGIEDAATLPDHAHDTTSDHGGSQSQHSDHHGGDDEEEEYDEGSDHNSQDDAYGEAAHEAGEYEEDVITNKYDAEGKQGDSEGIQADRELAYQLLLEGIHVDVDLDALDLSDPNDVGLKDTEVDEPSVAEASDSAAKLPLPSYTEVIETAGDELTMTHGEILLYPLLPASKKGQNTDLHAAVHHTASLNAFIVSRSRTNVRYELPMKADKHHRNMYDEKIIDIDCRIDRPGIAPALEVIAKFRHPKFSSTTRKPQPGLTHDISAKFLIGPVYDHVSKTTKRCIKPGTFKYTAYKDVEKPHIVIEFESEFAVCSNLVPPPGFVTTPQQQAIVNQMQCYRRPQGFQKVEIIVYQFGDEVNQKTFDFDILLKEFAEGNASQQVPFWGWRRIGNAPLAAKKGMNSRVAIIQSNVPWVMHPSTAQFNDLRHAEMVLGYGTLIEHNESSDRLAAMCKDEHLCTIHRIGSNGSTEYFLIRLTFSKRPVAANGSERYSVQIGAKGKAIIASNVSRTANIEVKVFTIDNAFDLDPCDVLLMASGRDVSELAPLATNDLRSKYKIKLTLETNPKTFDVTIDAIHKMLDDRNRFGNKGQFASFLLFDGVPSDMVAPWFEIEKRTGTYAVQQAMQWLMTDMAWDADQLAYLNGSKERMHGVAMVSGPGGSGKTELQIRSGAAQAMCGQNVLFGSERNDVVDYLADKWEKLRKAYPHLNLPEALRVYSTRQSLSSMAGNNGDALVIDESETIETRATLTHLAKTMHTQRNKNTAKSDLSVEGRLGQLLQKTSPPKVMHLFTDGNDEVTKRAKADEDFDGPQDMLKYLRDGLKKLQKHPFSETFMGQPGDEPPVDEDTSDEEPLREETTDEPPEIDGYHKFTTPESEAHAQVNLSNLPAIGHVDSYVSAQDVFDLRQTVFALSANEIDIEWVDGPRPDEDQLCECEQARVDQHADHTSHTTENASQAADNASQTADDAPETADTAAKENANTHDVAEYFTEVEQQLLGPEVQTLDAVEIPFWTERQKILLGQAYVNSRRHVVRVHPVIFTTLVNTASEEVRKCWAPEGLVFLHMDEATTFPEGHAYIPLVKASETWSPRIISITLYGDEKQIGPVIMGQDGQNNSIAFNEFHHQQHVSLFVREMKLGFKVYRLTHQNRSHSLIFEPPNQYHYDAKITSRGSSNFPVPSGLHDIVENVAGTGYRITPGSREHMFWLEIEGDNVHIDPGTGSSANFAHSKIVMTKVVRFLRDVFGDETYEKCLLITPYVAQFSEYADALNALRLEGFEDCQLPCLRTGDSSIGHDRDFVLLDVTKSKGGSGLGFTKDNNRVCTWFTRAKCFFMVVSGDLDDGESDAAISADPNALNDTKGKSKKGDNDETPNGMSKHKNAVVYHHDFAKIRGYLVSQTATSDDWDIPQSWWTPEMRTVYKKAQESGDVLKDAVVTGRKGKLIISAQDKAALNAKLEEPVAEAPVEVPEEFATGGFEAKSAWDAEKPDDGGAEGGFKMDGDGACGDSW